MLIVETEQDSESDLELAQDELLAAYRWMVLSRGVDRAELDLKKKGQAHFHISGAGHEAIQVAAALQLRPGVDWFYPYYRDRAFCLTLGVQPAEMLMAAVGAATDPSSAGRQMPSHWGNKTLNIVSQSSVTGTQCLQAVGCAEAGVMYRTIGDIEGSRDEFHADEVTYVSLGDGATSEGEFWESLNTACNHRLPVVYLIEDNEYAISTPVEVQTPGGNVSRLLGNFPGLKVIQVDGTDFLESYGAFRDALSYARNRLGPALVHAKVVRLHSHSASDTQSHYRTAEECCVDEHRDPIRRLGEYLAITRHVKAEMLSAIDAEVAGQVEEAVNAALAAPKPSPDTATALVYSPNVDPSSCRFDTAPNEGGEVQPMVAMINRVLHAELAANPRIVVFGQDVADCSRQEYLHSLRGQGGVFKVTTGLQRAYPKRVFNAPIAEANIVGRAIGMSTRGLKPVVEIQFFDYIWPAMMQIRNELSMMRYRSAGAFSCPMVIRVPIGGYLKGGSLYHSQSGESIFAHCPGLRIVFPSNASDAAGLLRTAIRCDDPVLFLEHKHLYREASSRRPDPGNDFMIPFAKAQLCLPGQHVAIITWGALVPTCVQAAEKARQQGLEVAVLDLRTIAPYDWKAVANLVAMTNRVIIVHEDQLTCGFGAELAARIAGELFGSLDAPVMRVASKDTPVPYCPDLESVILPSEADILTAIQAVAQY